MAKSRAVLEGRCLECIMRAISGIMISLLNYGSRMSIIATIYCRIIDEKKRAKVIKELLTGYELVLQRQHE